MGAETNRRTAFDRQVRPGAAFTSSCWVVPIEPLVDGTGCRDVCAAQGESLRPAS
jgi:hypothetical protein